MKIAVVGLGYWGPNIVRVLRQIPDVEVLIYDEDQKKIDAIPHVRYFGSWAEILSSPIDAVVLVTPISSHFKLAWEVLQAGKHVFVEKPLATKIRDAEDLCFLAKQKNLLLMPGHTFLYSPAVRFVRQMLANHALGDIEFVSMNRLNASVHTTEADVLWDLGPHDFSILRYWFPNGSFSAMRCTADSHTAIVSTRLEEFLAAITLTWRAPIRQRNTTIVGSRGMIVYDDIAERPVTHFAQDGSTWCPTLDTKEPLLAEMEDFIEAIRRYPTHIPTSNDKVGLDVVRMVEMAHNAAHEPARTNSLA